MHSAMGGWSRTVAEEGPSSKHSCHWEQPSARMGEMHAGRPPSCGRGTTHRAASPGARSG
eukprot:scaffold17477_cov66-Phaeocystis_antarctica.AAC.1